MAYAHGRRTVITVGGDDISLYIKNSEITRKWDTHQVTGYGVDDHLYEGGIGDHKFTMEGSYFTGATGPRAVLSPLGGTTVEILRKPEGTGTGKPLETFDVVVGQYVETNPVNDMITWSCECVVSGAIADTTQA